MDRHTQNARQRRDRDLQTKADAMPFDLQQTINRLKVEKTRLWVLATELRRVTSCEHYHHSKRDQHKAGEPCPIEQWYDKILEENR